MADYDFPFMARARATVQNTLSPESDEPHVANPHLNTPSARHIPTPQYSSSGGSSWSIGRRPAPAPVPPPRRRQRSRERQPRRGRSRGRSRSPKSRTFVSEATQLSPPRPRDTTWQLTRSLAQAAVGVSPATPADTQPRVEARSPSPSGGRRPTHKSPQERHVEEHLASSAVYKLLPRVEHQVSQASDLRVRSKQQLEMNTALLETLQRQREDLQRVSEAERLSLRRPHPAVLAMSHAAQPMGQPFQPSRMGGLGDGPATSTAPLPRREPSPPRALPTSPASPPPSPPRPPVVQAPLPDVQAARVGLQSRSPPRAPSRSSSPGRVVLQPRAGSMAAQAAPTGPPPALMQPGNLSPPRSTSLPGRASPKPSTVATAAAAASAAAQAALAARAIAPPMEERPPLPPGAAQPRKPRDTAPRDAVAVMTPLPTSGPIAFGAAMRVSTPREERRLPRMSEPCDKPVRPGGYLSEDSLSGTSDPLHGGGRPRSRSRSLSSSPPPRDRRRRSKSRTRNHAHHHAHQAPAAAPRHRHHKSHKKPKRSCHSRRRGERRRRDSSPGRASDGDFVRDTESKYGWSGDEDGVAAPPSAGRPEAPRRSAGAASGRSSGRPQEAAPPTTSYGLWAPVEEVTQAGGGVAHQEHRELYRTTEALYHTLNSWKRYGGSGTVRVGDLDPTTRKALERWQSQQPQARSESLNRALATSELTRRLMRRDKVFRGRHVSELPQPSRTVTFAGNPGASDPALAPRQVERGSQAATAVEPRGPPPAAAPPVPSAAAAPNVPVAMLPPESLPTGASAPPVYYCIPMTVSGDGAPVLQASGAVVVSSSGLPVTLPVSSSATVPPADTSPAVSAPISVPLDAAVATAPPPTDAAGVELPPPEAPVPPPVGAPVDAPPLMSDAFRELPGYVGEPAAVPPPSPRSELEAYRSLMAELCEEVHVQHVDDLLPRIQQLCMAVLALPAVDAFATQVCDILGRFMAPQQDPPLDIGMEQSVTVLHAVLSELQHLRALHATARPPQ